MSASGTLYVSYTKNNFKAYKIQAAAKYSGAVVNVVQDTDTSPDFLKKFPLGKFPAFEGNNGTLLTEADAIAFYVANETLRGSNVQDQAQVQMFVNLADNEILQSACNWVFPTLGIMKYNKQNTERAKKKLMKVMSYLNEYLTTRTFLVGERVTLADIAVVCNLLMLYKKVFDPGFRQPYGNVTRWFVTVVNQPEFVAVIGKVSLCKKMAQFDAPFTDTSKEGKKDNKREKPPREEEEEEPKEPAKKFVDPYKDLPKSPFILDAWKRSYSFRCSKELADWFLDNVDLEGWSLWRGNYKYKKELKKIFMTSNLVQGMIDRLDKFRKYGFAVVYILGEDFNNEISGIWLMRGQDLAFSIVPDWNIDAESYTWTKLDITQQADKEMVRQYFSDDGPKIWDNVYHDIRPIADIKVFN